MTFKWEDYLQVADNCVSLGDEAHARSVVSRSYYAAFGVAYDLLTPAQKQYVDSETGAGSHEKVWAYYNEDEATRAISIGREGRSFKRWRIIADYKSNVSVEMHEAEKAIDRAKDLIADLNSVVYGEGD